MGTSVLRELEELRGMLETPKKLYTPYKVSAEAVAPHYQCLDGHGAKPPLAATSAPTGGHYTKDLCRQQCDEELLPRLE